MIEDVKNDELNDEFYNFLIDDNFKANTYTEQLLLKLKENDYNSFIEYNIQYKDKLKI